MTIKDLSYPRINDIATDLDRPLPFEAALDAQPNAGRDMGFPSRFAPSIRKAYPDVRPLFLDMPAKQVFQRVDSLAQNSSGWRVVKSDPANGTLEAEVATALLRFVDDVVVQVGTEGARTRVDMRSKSREGLIDAGKNAKRIANFLEKLSTVQ